MNTSKNTIVLLLALLLSAKLQAQEPGKGKPAPAKALTVTIGSADVFCNGTTVTLNANLSGGTGPYTYNWSTGGAGASENVALNSNKTVSITVTDNGTSDIAIDTLGIDALPNLTYTGDNLVCTGSPLSFTATGASTYNWYNNWSLLGTGSPFETSFTIVQPYFIKLVGTDGSGCKDTLEFVLNTKTSPEVSLATDTVLCEGLPYSLNGMSSASGATEYYWSLNGQALNDDSSTYEIGLSPVSPSDSGTYCLTATIGYGSGLYCYDYDSTYLNVLPAPQVTAPPDQDFCNRDLVKVWHSGNDTSLSYNWSLVGPNQVSFDKIEDTIQFVRPALDYDYYFLLTATDSNGCSSTDTTIVGEFERPDPIIHKPGEYLCEGERALFTIEEYDSRGEHITVYWRKADTMAYEMELTISSGFASEAVYIYNEYGCEYAFYPNITVLSPEGLSIDAVPDTVCKGSKAKLLFEGGYQVYYNSSLIDSIYYIQPQNSRYYSFRAEKIYTKYEKTCTIYDSIYVSVNQAGQPPVVDSFGVFYEGALPDPITAEGENLTWYNEYGVVYSRDSVLQLPYLRAGTYDYSVTQQSGSCESDPAPVEITVKTFNNKVMPNLITPNGDGYNDYFIIDNADQFSDSQLWIYDRFGREVYYSSPYQNDWDGKRDDGKQMPAGTYFWVLTMNKEKIMLKGDITILR